MDAPTRLSNWPWVVVRVDCKLCPRRGAYRLARHHRFGPEMDLVLLTQLATDCPWNRSGCYPRPYEVRCGVRFTDWDHRRPTLDVSPGPHRNAPGPPTRTLTLADLPGPTVAIVCRPCRRRGVLRVDRLIARFGAELPLPTLLTRLAANCRGRFEATPRCQAVYEDPIG